MKSIEILNENGEVVNTIIASEEYAEQNFTGKWRLSEFQPSLEPPSTIPQVVTRRQARQALLLSGKLHQVDQVIDSIDDDTVRALARIEWEDATEFERNRPILLQIASALNLSDAELDDLFVLAASL